MFPTFPHSDSLFYLSPPPPAFPTGGNTSTHTDTVSLGSGSEFSGWKSQVPTGLDTGGTTDGTIAATPDVQSVSSLDLYANKKDDTSPQDSTQVSIVTCVSVLSMEKISEFYLKCSTMVL